MNILLTEIQYRHLEAFVHRYGFNKIINGFNIQRIELKIEPYPGGRDFNPYMKHTYMLIIEGYVGIDSMIEFMQHLKNI